MENGHHILLFLMKHKCVWEKFMVVYSYCSILVRALAVNFTATDSLLIFFFEPFGFIECRRFIARSETDSRTGVS